MKKTHIKQLIISILLAGLSVTTAFAATGAAVGPDCTEVLNPYKFGANSNPPGSASLYTKTNFSEAECKSHAPYPNQHNPISASQEQNVYVLPQAAIDNDVHFPWTIHNHTYVNNSKEDHIGNPNLGFLYGAYMAAFEITVEKDAVDNTDTSNMQCPVFGNQVQGSSTYNAFRNCQNGAKDSSIWGGVELVRQDFSDRIVLRYNFGVDTSSGKPWNVGENPTYDKGDNPAVFGVNTSLESNRSFDMPGLSFVSKNNTENIWTATSTSRALVRDRVFNKANIGNYNTLKNNNQLGSCNAGGWCFLEPTNSSIYGNNIDIDQANGWDYYWVKVGTDTTVWKKHDEQPPACDDLTLSIKQSLNTYPSTNVTGLLADTPMTLTVTPSFIPSNESIPLEYRYEAILNNGFQGSFKDNSNANDDNNPYKDDDTSTYFSGAPGGTNIVVIAYDENNQQQQQCSKQFTIPDTPPPACDDLTLSINQGGNIYPSTNVTGLLADTPMSLTVTPSFTPSNGSIPLEYRYEAILNNGFQGSFKDNSNANDDDNPYRDDDVNTYFSGAPGGTDVVVIAYDENNQQQQQCSKEFTIPDTPPPSFTCDALELIPNFVNPPTVNNGETSYTARVTFRDSSNNIVPTTQTFNTTLQWNGTNGTFQSSQTPQQQTNGTNNPFTNTFTASDVPASVSVQVTAIDGAALGQCNEAVVVNTPPENNICKDLNPTVNNNPSTNISVLAGDAILLGGFPENTQAPHPAMIRWTETGPGHFIKVGFNPLCPTPADDTPFNAPASCQYVYQSSVTPGGSAVFEAQPNIGNVGACREAVTIIPEGTPPVCESITWETPSNGELNPGTGESTDLRARVHFSDNKSYDTSVLWSGNNGTFSNGNSTNTDQHNSASTFKELFTNTDMPADARIRVTSATDNNGNSIALSPACQGGLPIETPPETVLCEGISTYKKSNGETCLDVEGGYTGPFTWEYGNGDIKQTDDPHCQDIDDNVPFTVEATNEPNNPACQLEYDCEEIETYEKGNEICVDVTRGGYDGPFTWIVNGNEISDNDDCAEIDDNDSFEVFADYFPQVCRAEREPEEPELIKEARRSGSVYSRNILTLSANDTTIDYQLTYKPPTNQEYSTTITDTIGENGYIEAILLPEGSDVNPGRITYNNDMEVKVNDSSIGKCVPPAEGEKVENCYIGDIGNNNGVVLFHVRGDAEITYSGSVKSALIDDVCKNGKICQEKYLNNAKTNNSVIHIDEENSNEVPEVTSNRITAQIFCQYILTRAAGDIFLENDLSTGVDISICSKFTTSTGIIITPGEEEINRLISTGENDTTIQTIGHEVCTAGQAGTVPNELKDLYGSNVSGLSSQICEVKLRTGSPWKQDVITNSIDENKTRVSRWGADPALPKILSSILLNSQLADQNVYHLTGNVTSGNIRMDEVGAKTFIIEDGDLYIDQDIEYTGTCPAGSGQCSVRDVGSLAFIVLNGNIYVEPGVETISGVFFVQEGETAGTGQLISGSPSNPDQRADEKRLTIKGSVYGDIDPLFRLRFLAGDPSKDEGGIVVRFDQRVILNTPPGLRDVLNLSQTEVAR